MYKILLHIVFFFIYNERSLHNTDNKCHVFVKFSFSAELCKSGKISLL